MSYCTIEEVNSLFGDISDDILPEQFKTVINNSSVWINSNLRRNYLPLPKNIPETLKTVAIYYSASDILLSLYHGEELPIQYDIWFNKAKELLDDYIDEEKRRNGEPATYHGNKSVAHGKSRPYRHKW